MQRLLKFFSALGETDAQPLVNCVAAMLVAFGLLTCVKLYAATFPYHYSVQCKAPANPGSRVVLTSRRSGLSTEGPAADARGVAAVTSEQNFDYYDITLENSPCRTVDPRRP